MKIGVLLKKEREINNLSQQEIADVLNISQRTYSNFESDKTLPSIIHLSKLSLLLNFDLFDFLKKQNIEFYQGKLD